MKLYTIGFTQKSAEEFFEGLKGKDISTLIDVRLNNKSQLAGFAKGRDLKYFLFKLCNISYFYEEKFAPTKELLEDWKKNKILWEEYEFLYKRILINRDAEKIFTNRFLMVDYALPGNICFLCSESTPENCHRRLLAEYLKEYCPSLENAEIIHL